MTCFSSRTASSMSVIDSAASLTLATRSDSGISKLGAAGWDAGSAVAADGEAVEFSRDCHGIWSHPVRSEEHTSELQSQSNLVCRLLLEKKKKNISNGLLMHRKQAVPSLIEVPAHS